MDDMARRVMWRGAGISTPESRSDCGRDVELDSSSIAARGRRGINYIYTHLLVLHLYTVCHMHEVLATRTCSRVRMESSLTRTLVVNDLNRRNVGEDIYNRGMWYRPRPRGGLTTIPLAE